MGSRPCQVCNEAASKYKCPSCLLPYCSLTCFKKHKEVPCTKPVSSEETTTISVSQHVEEKIISVDKPIYVDEPNEALDEAQLKAIASCSEIRDALKNSDLQKLIITINSSENAEEEFEKAMGLDVFRQFTDKVLSSVNP